jgi:hypothetical protein
MQADKVAYLGISWGGYMGGIIPAVEKRIKVVVLNVGGILPGWIPTSDPLIERRKRFGPHAKVSLRPRQSAT